MRAPHWMLWLTLLTVTSPVFLAPTPVFADDDDEGEDEEEEEFETTWISAKLGVWYRPAMNMNVQVGGDGAQLAGLLGTDFDLQRTLGVTENVHSEYEVDVDQEAIFELEIGMDTEWISVYLTIVPPFEYQGSRTLTQTLEFGGQSFSASTTVESSFEQAWGGADVTINILNTRYVKVAPLVGLRLLAIDWQVKETLGGLKADTTDIDSPMQWGDFQVFPYPEVGGDVRVGYRDIIEGGIRASAAYLQYLDMEGGTYRVELFANFHPIPYIGLHLGVRYVGFDIHSRSDDPDDRYDFELEYTGVMFGLSVRI